MQSAPHRGINKTTLRPDVAIRQQAQRRKQPRVSGTVCDQEMALPHLVSFHFSVSALLFTHWEITGSDWALIVQGSRYKKLIKNVDV